MSRAVRHVPAALDSELIPALTQALLAALDGSGPAVLPTAPGQTSVAGGSRSAVGASDAAGGQHTGSDDREVPDEVAVLVRTSGSTGDPREVMLTAEALHASIAATHSRLGGPGRWLLALPPAHIAGLQVLARSAVAGTTPVLLPGPFRPEQLVVAARRMPSDGMRYISLVPTQLHRLLADPAAREELAGFDAVLLGGAAAPDSLITQAGVQGISVVTTYGMSETCGGCVYDGIALDGVEVLVDGDGRILIAGAVLAAGYRGRPELTTQTFVTAADGVRRMRTSDLGIWRDRNGQTIPAQAPTRSDHLRLTVVGRIDDVVITGGEKVAPAAVERVIATLPGVAEVCVVGVPDPQWGQAVTAVLVLTSGALEPSPTELRSAVATVLGPAAAPRYQLVLTALPLRGPGKIDRREVAAVATDLLTR